MVHLWQHEFGKPSKTTYHNNEWAAKMEAIGLMPSNTGKPGGKKIGYRMDDYVIAGGMFEKAFKSIPKKYLLPWKCTEPLSSIQLSGSTEGGTNNSYYIEEEILEEVKSALSAANSKNKSKYSCPQCKMNVWGKSHLYIICGDCKRTLEEQKQSLYNKYNKGGEG
jgi:hypothetical protein